MAYELDNNKVESARKFVKEDTSIAKPMGTISLNFKPNTPLQIYELWVLLVLR